MIKDFYPTQLEAVNDEGTRLFTMSLEETDVVSLNFDAVLSLDEFEECVCAIRQGFSVLGATIVVKDHAD